MALWNSLPGIMRPIPIREFKGVNKLDPFSIAEGQATDMKNLTSSEYPTLTVKPGNTMLGTAFAAQLTGLGVRKDTELHAISNGEWKKWDGSAWGAALTTGLSITALCSFTNFKGNFSDYNLLMANGVDAVKKFDGTTVSNLANAPSGAQYIDAHDNRVYAAKDNTVYFSALRKAEDWSTVDDAGQIVVETSMGEKISSIKAGPGHLIVFTPHTSWELYGTGPHNYRLMPVSDQIGCVAHGSAQMINGILYFLGHDGIYQYAGGAQPRKEFALPVQGIIDTLNTANRHKSVAGTDGKKLYLAIPTGANTEPNTVLEYDPTFGTWYVWDMAVSQMAYMGEKWYMAKDSVLEIGGTTDNGTPVSWEWISRPFESGSMVTRKKWYRLWVVVDCPTGSTLDIYLSSRAEGETWTLVKSIPAQSDVQVQQILLPIDTIANDNYVRLKLMGTGPCKIHEITRQERVIPIGN